MACLFFILAILVILDLTCSLKTKFKQWKLLRKSLDLRGRKRKNLNFLKRITVFEKECWYLFILPRKKAVNSFRYLTCSVKKSVSGFYLIHAWYTLSVVDSNCYNFPPLLYLWIWVTFPPQGPLWVSFAGYSCKLTLYYIRLSTPIYPRMQLLVRTIFFVCATNLSFLRFQVDDVESLKSTNLSPTKVGNNFLCILLFILENMSEVRNPIGMRIRPANSMLLNYLLKKYWSFSHTIIGC